MHVVRVIDEVWRKWNEEDHPRHPPGSPDGGQFAPADGGGNGGTDGDGRVASVAVRGKPSTGTLTYMGRTWKKTSMKEAEQISQLMHGMLQKANLSRPVSKFVLDFSVELDESGDKGGKWVIGLKGSHFESALAVSAHEVGHLTQVRPPGGMGRPDYVERRVEHERQAWLRGKRLLKQTGFEMSKDFVKVFNYHMNMSLARYRDYFDDRWRT